MPIRKLTVEVDDFDRQAILNAIAERQTWRHPGHGGVLIPDGDGDLAGRLLGEVCRGWLEFVRMEDEIEEDADD